MKSTLVVVLVSVIGASTAWASTPRTVASVKRCFAAHQVFVDAVDSAYYPASIEPRPRQVAVSFALTPGEVALTGTVFVAKSAADAMAVRERLIAWQMKYGRAPRDQVAPYSELHATTVLDWGGTAHRRARAIVVTCLGPRTG